MSGIIAAHYVAGGAAASVSDSFNRADNASSLGTADTGQVWSALLGTWGISGNKAYKPSGAGQSFAVVESGLADCTIAVTVSGTLTAGGGICFRATDANNLWFVEMDVGQTLLYKVQAGGYSAPVTGMATFAVGDVMSVVLSGSSISVRKNGAQIGSHTSTFNQSATKQGLRAYGNAVQFDDFSVTA